jgi:hypothetical protein
MVIFSAYVYRAPVSSVVKLYHSHLILYIMEKSKSA